jgi:putative transposase
VDAGPCFVTGIAVEDLSVAGLARTKPAKSVHDAGWSSFVNTLEYKAARYDRTLVKIGRFTAASACGAPVRPGAIPAQREETGSHGLPTGNRAA